MGNRVMVMGKSWGQKTVNTNTWHSCMFSFRHSCMAVKSYEGNIFRTPFVIFSNVSSVKILFLIRCTFVGIQSGPN